MVKKYERLVAHIASQYSVVGDVEDLQQSAWLVLAEQLRKYDGRIPIGAFVALHVRWAILNALFDREGAVRRKGKRTHLNMVEYDDRVHVCDDRERNDRDIDVRSLLARLPESERDAIVRLVVIGPKSLGSSKQYGNIVRRRIIQKLRRIANVE